MRQISFALTTKQIRTHSKTVTRRMGWATLMPGTLLQPIRKGQGLKKGERVEKIGGPIRVVRVTREPIAAVSVDDTRREGFPGMQPEEFVRMFVAMNAGCNWRTVVTRIEFSYVEDGQ